MRIGSPGRLALAGLGAALALVAVAPIGAAAPTATGQASEFIVKFRNGETPSTLGPDLRLLDRLTDGAVLVAADDDAPVRALKARDDVEYVEPNGLLDIAYIPNDPLFPPQWNYHEAVGGTRVDSAWNFGVTGSGVTTAVIDTGRTWHPDLSANYIGGYDMISDPVRAGDGNGRDAIPTDQGDWVVANQCAAGSPAHNSSWHGLHVAGTVAELRDNATGGSGVAPLAKVVPVRVLGKCGGTDADVAAGIVWAAGGVVPGVPVNPNPAKVLNLSLGRAGACPAILQSAINTARNFFGASVVVAAGNGNVNAVNATPANCVGVIAVGASDRQGDKASYSNFGATVKVCAPGGETALMITNGILSLMNSGANAPAASIFAYRQGTSMAAPHVTGTIALMQHWRLLSAQPQLTPTQVASRLAGKPMPSGYAACGKGLLDAAASVTAAMAP